MWHEKRRWSLSVPSNTCFGREHFNFVIVLDGYGTERDHLTHVNLENHH